jgi:hypothetical protein
MSSKEVESEPQDRLAAPSEALAALDPAAALRHAAALWAEQNTRPETLSRAEKLRARATPALTSRSPRRRSPTRR